VEPPMSLLERVRILEARAATERGVFEKALLCDYGPYAPEPLARTFVVNGSFRSGEAIYSGRTEIHAFYKGLAATRTMHWYTNLVVTSSDSSSIDEPASSENSMKCYGYEAPTIHRTAVVGAFMHHATCNSIPAPVRWTDWEQEVFFLSPLRSGFGLTGTRNFNQTMSSDQATLGRSDEFVE
jgi:hypothetical protein